MSAAFGHGLVRVYDRHGRGYRRTLSGAQGRTARDMESFVARLRVERKWALLDHIIADRASIADLFYAERDGTLPELLARLDAAAVPGLAALLDAWTPMAHATRYPVQGRVFVAWLAAQGHPATLASFTRKRVSEFLASLAVQGPTRNRYRAALMQFGKWLVEREQIAANPVREVAGFRENDPRMVHYTREQAAALLAQIPSPQYRALEALMAGTGAEWSAVTRVRSGDDLREPTREVYADGAKTKWRKRWVRFTEEWAWPLFWSYAETVPAGVRLFAGVTPWTALAAHRKATTAASLERSTLHDWRHTYAILSLDDGIKPATVRRQLGHAPNSTVLERVYAAHLPSVDADYEKRTPRQKAPATVTAIGTTPRRRVK